MTTDAILDGVRAIAIRLAGPDRLPALVDPDTPLGEGGLNLDSVELLELMLACEAELGMVFDGDPASNERALTTLSTLASAIRARPRT